MSGQGELVTMNEDELVTKIRLKIKRTTIETKRMEYDVCMELDQWVMVRDVPRLCFDNERDTTSQDTHRRKASNGGGDISRCRRGQGK